MPADQPSSLLSARYFSSSFPVSLLRAYQNRELPPNGDRCYHPHRPNKCAVAYFASENSHDFRVLIPCFVCLTAGRLEVEGKGSRDRETGGSP